MNKPTFRPILILALLLVFALSACTAATPSPTPTSAPPTDTPEPTEGPPLSEGSYTTTITKEDFKELNIPEDQICEPIGTFTLTLQGNVWYLDQTPAEGCTVRFSWGYGSWEPLGKKGITFHDDFGAGCQIDYTYIWSVDGSQLNLQNGDDGCQGRVIIMSSHPWVKQATASKIPEVFKNLELWEDATQTTIGTTGEWTNKVELADINGDGLVDILFANGGNYDSPGTPVFSQVFLNQGAGKMFKEITESIFGSTKMLARVIKVRDVNGDTFADILVGTAYQTQSRLYLGDGSGGFSDVTATHLPQINASVGDMEFGDVDGDGDLDVVLSAYPEGRTMLWLNDGFGHFSDATDAQMPDISVKSSWFMECVDVDNDYDLDILIPCNRCESSFLFENDGLGIFSDVSAGRLPSTRAYDFEAMDLNGDGFLDVIAINVNYAGSHLFINNQQGGYEDATSHLWSDKLANPAADDNMAAFLDYDSDGNADFIIGSLTGPDRLLINDGSGNLMMHAKVFSGENTPGTLYLALADLNGDHKLDVVMAQGENQLAMDDRVFLGTNIQPDTAPPIITLVEQVEAPTVGQPIQVRARVHDNKSPTMPHDWQSVLLKWTAGDASGEAPMQWYGEYLWRAVLEQAPLGMLSYQVCATDTAGNQACSEMVDVEVK
jgi:hypothetical protein